MAQSPHIPEKTVPPQPGESPIPAGTVRLFHYTDPKNFPAIREQGLVKSKARGDDLSGTGPSAGVWASTRPWSEQHCQVEFWAKPDEISHYADYPWRDEDPVAWAKEGEHHVILWGDAPPDRIVALHEPWHHRVRYLYRNLDYFDQKEPNFFSEEEAQDLEQHGARDEARAVRYVMQHRKTAADPAIPSLQEFLAKQGGLEGLISSYEIDDEELKMYGYESGYLRSIEARYRQMARRFSRFPLVLYREVSLDPKKGLAVLDKSHMGISWTATPIEEGTFWQGGAWPGEASWIFKAEVGPEAIDWMDTMWHRFYPSLGEQEDEVTLKEGAKVRVVSVKRAEEGGWRPFGRTVTAVGKAQAKRPGPVTLYHGTFSSNVPSILENGLEPGEGWGGAGTSGVFLSSRPEGALYWAKLAYQRSKGGLLEADRFDRQFSLGQAQQVISVLKVVIPAEATGSLRADMEQAEDASFEGGAGDWEASLERIGDVVYKGTIPASWISPVGRIGQPRTVTAATVPIPTLDEVVRWGGSGPLEMVDWGKVLDKAKHMVGVDVFESLSRTEKDKRLDREGMELLRSQWRTAKERLEALRFPLVVYRSLAFTTAGWRNWRKEVERRGFGTSWSYDEHNAYVEKELAGRHIIVFRGTIGSPDEVDWERTMYLNTVVEDEREVSLRPGARVVVNEWKERGKRGWNPVGARPWTVTAEGPVPDQAQTPEFKRWFRGSVVKLPDGRPRPVYHGSTHSFEAFSLGTSNPESWYGRALYFTDSPEDVGRNYATPEFPDLQRRIDFRTEQLLDKLVDELKQELGEGIGWNDRDRLEEDARSQAAKELTGPAPMTYKLYLRIERPVVIRKGGGTYFEINYNERTNTETGSGMRLYRAVMKAAGQLGLDGQQVWREAMGEEYGDYFTAQQFEENLRTSDSMVEARDWGKTDEGDFLSLVYRLAGFDGIVMEDAGSTFQNMGIPSGTTHYTVWNPRQVKSAWGNVGTWSTRSPRMTASWEEEEGYGAEDYPQCIGDYEFRTTCVSEGTGRHIQEMLDSAKDCGYGEVKRHCEGLRQWENASGYAPDGSRKGLTLRHDWSVSYGKGTYREMPCYFVVWSAIEHVWTRKGVTAAKESSGYGPLPEKDLWFSPKGREIVIDDSEYHERALHKMGLPKEWLDNGTVENGLDLLKEAKRLGWIRVKVMGDVVMVDADYSLPGMRGRLEDIVIRGGLDRRYMFHLDSLGSFGAYQSELTQQEAFRFVRQHAKTVPKTAEKRSMTEAEEVAWSRPLYHATSVYRARKIKQAQGFDTDRGGYDEMGRGVYVHPSMNRTAPWARGEGAFLEIHFTRPLRLAVKGRAMPGQRELSDQGFDGVYDRHGITQVPHQVLLFNHLAITADAPAEHRLNDKLVDWPKTRVIPFREDRHGYLRGLESPEEGQFYRGASVPNEATAAEGPGVLYHGTTKKNLPSIMSEGLKPVVGRYAELWHGRDHRDTGKPNSLTPVTFAATKEHLDDCLLAIFAALSEDFPKTSTGQFFDNAVLLELPADQFTKSRWKRPPRSMKHVEPEDYYSTRPVRPIRAITGEELRGFAGDAYRKARQGWFGAYDPENPGHGGFFSQAGAVPEEVLYHYSRRTNRRSIRENGLAPQIKEYRDIDREPGVYLFSTLEMAESYGQDHAEYVNQPVDIWEVRLPEGARLEADEHPDMVGYDAFVCYDPIPPENLRFVSTILLRPKMAQAAAEPGEAGDKEWTPWIGVDLDGTLAEEQDPFDPLTIGKPVPEMVEKVKKALEDGVEVRVFTARLADEKLRGQIREKIREYTREHIGRELDSTNEKDPGLREIWDDKARRVRRDEGTFALRGSPGKTARRKDYLLDAGWIDEDGRYYPCMQGEHHGEAAVREHLVDAGPAYEDLYDEEGGELDSDALSDMVEQAMDLGNVRVSGHPFTEFDAMWDNVRTRSNIARAIRDNPGLQRVDIEFHRPEHTYMKDLQPQEALRWMQSGERPEQGGKVGALSPGVRIVSRGTMLEARSRYGRAGGELVDAAGLAEWKEENGLHEDDYLEDDGGRYQDEKSLLGAKSKSFTLLGMEVRPEHRRKGVGTVLATALLQAARAAGATECWLHASPLDDVTEEEDLISFYRSLGFEVYSEDGQIMYKPLAGEGKQAARSRMPLGKGEWQELAENGGWVRSNGEPLPMHSPVDMHGEWALYEGLADQEDLEGGEDELGQAENIALRDGHLRVDRDFGQLAVQMHSIQRSRRLVLEALRMMQFGGRTFLEAGPHDRPTWSKEFGSTADAAEWLEAL